MGKRALDFLIEHSGTRKNLEVDFFGGEPLMNFDMIQELVRYARSLEPIYNKHFRFTLTTNGVLLDEKVIEFAQPGVPQRSSEPGRAQGSSRPLPGGLCRQRQSWEKIVPK